MDAETSSAIVARRLRAQRLTGAPCATPEAVVGQLCAVQAQDYGLAKWSVGGRALGASDELVEAAFTSGAILRTHVLRSTWHFVLPGDIRWLLTATAPRVKARDAGRYARLGLDARTLRRSTAALTSALRGGGRLTRAEAAAVLTAAGIGVEGQRLPYLLMAAELDALVCSGPRRGKQHTYMLLEERAPGARDLPRDEALTELARRFVAGHGPATAKDLAVWASLTLAEARPALERAVPALQREEIEGITFWSAPGDKAGGTEIAEPSPSVRLVPGYDEYIMGHSDTKPLLARAGSPWDPATPPVFRLVVLLDGGVVGFWRRTLEKHRVIVEAELLERFDDLQLRALEAEAARYGAFLGLESVVRITGSPP